MVGTSACTARSRLKPRDPSSEPREPAATVQRVPRRVQPRPTARSAEPRDAVLSLPAISARISEEAAAHRVPRALREAPGEPRWRHPVSLGAVQRDAYARRRVRRSRRGRHRILGRVLRPRLSGASRRTNVPDRWSDGKEPKNRKSLTLVPAIICNPCTWTNLLPMSSAAQGPSVIARFEWILYFLRVLLVYTGANLPRCQH